MNEIKQPISKSGVRHLTPTSEGAYIVDCFDPECKDPTHRGGTILDSAKFLDDQRKDKGRP